MTLTPLPLHTCSKMDAEILLLISRIYRFKMFDTDGSGTIDASELGDFDRVKRQTRLGVNSESKAMCSCTICALHQILVDLVFSLLVNCLKLVVQL